MIDYENMDPEYMDERNNKLTEIFSRVGKEYRYDSVQAEFMAFTEVKVRWQRTYGWADFKVSDYLIDAPDKVLEKLAISLFSRIRGDESEYPSELLEWITAPDFSKEKSPVYLSRCPQYLNTMRGKAKNLNDSYDRLVEKGLILDDPSVTLTWEMEGSQKMGHCSVLMRVASVSERLDREDVPDYVLDYCLYHELCHIVVGYNPDGNMHDDAYYELENKYPFKEEARGWLRTQDTYA